MNNPVINFLKYFFSRRKTATEITLDEILFNQSIIIKNQNKMEKTLDDLIAKVTEQSGQLDSLTTLTSGIKQKLDDILKGKLPPELQAKVDKVFTDVDANSKKIVDAINANDDDPNTPPVEESPTEEGTGK